MKIAIVRQRYNPYGGAERFVERALGALCDEGAAVSLITRNWDGAPRAGFEQITCDPAYSKMLGGRSARDRSFARAVQAVIQTRHFDVVQSHERIPGCTIFRAGDGVHAAWLAHRSRQLGRLARLGQHYSAYHRYVLAAEQAMFAHPALRTVICNSRMVADEIEAFYGVDRRKLAVIYNGIDPAVFHPGLRDEFRAATRAQIGLDVDTPVLIYVGSGFERKGVPQLLRAFAQLPEQASHLIIVGADRKLKAMQALAASLGVASRVRFTGPVKDVRPWYGAADAFVLPTLYDPCPNAALEALACGLPTVTTTGCGAREWIQEGENGYVVDALDLAALADALAKVQVLGQRPETVQRARAAVAALTLPAMAGRLLALYRTL